MQTPGIDTRLAFTVALAAALVTSAVTIAAQRATTPDPLLKANTTVKVSEHVYAIPDGGIGGVPNVGIIVGSRATLVIDTGLGPPNARIILAEVAKVSKNTELYLSATHYHPEHAGSAAAFPTARFILPDVQAKELAEQGPQMLATFAARTPVMGELLKGVTVRAPDMTFDREHMLDLGNVRVRMFVVGPTHTRGDTAFFVEGDGVLFSGDVVMKTFPGVNANSTIGAWVAAQDRFAALQPRRIVPAHGPLGDASMVSDWQNFFRDVRTRTAALKSEGKTVEEAVQTLTGELQSKYPSLSQPNRIAGSVRAAYAEGR
jgi:glyoxylase-like metal-dependent hydrolase (beta-lactamase superfamily II)